MEKNIPFQPEIEKITKNLWISRDYSRLSKFFFPVFLFEPSYSDGHYHIELTKKQAIKLRNWLNKYIKDRK